MKLQSLPEAEARALLAAAALRLKYTPKDRTLPTDRERKALEAKWDRWLKGLFPSYVPYEFADFHEELWEWVWDIEEEVAPDPFVAIWARGAAKSTNAELAVAAIGARRRRRYVLYVCETQDQADDHVANIASILESEAFGRIYPDVSARQLTKYGQSRGWRRNRLRTRSGFTVDALGLDKAARGLKFDEDRPDMVVFDDLDGELDTEETTNRKVTRITRKIMPAGTSDLAVLAVQNLVHPDSIFARLADLSENKADFLSHKILSGPFPAIEDLTVSQRGDGSWEIVEGTPTWEGQDVEACQHIIDLVGISAFKIEYQHEVEMRGGGIFDHLDYQRIRWEDLPQMIRIVVWVDPAVTDTDNSDSHGIIADGLAADGKIYRLWCWERRTTPEDSLKRAIKIALHFRAEAVGVETDQGGDTWRPVFREALREVLAEMKKDGKPLPEIKPRFRHAKAGQGHGPKTHRASLMLRDYETAKIVHVIGTHLTLERALNRFPKIKPLDLADAAYWSWADLRGRAGDVGEGPAVWE